MTNTNDPYVEFSYTGDGDLPDEELQPKPAPAVIPPWYRALEAFTDSDDPISSTVKMCRPFSDAMKLGFVLPVPDEVRIKKNEYGEMIASNDFVSTYGATPYTSDGNSRSPLPEAKVKNPWRIRMPPGYSALITKPLNREVMIPGVKQHAMLVPADEYDGPVNIPISLTDSEVTLSAGDPLVQVIPIKRDRVIDTIETVKTSERTTEKERYNRKQKRANARPDLYRSVHWVKKPHTTLYDEEDAGDHGYAHSVEESTVSPAGDEVRDQSMVFITDDENYNVIPEPVQASDAAPPWVDSLATELESSSDADRDVERFQSWIKAATSLGAVTRFHAEVRLVQTGEGLEYSTTYDKPAVKIFSPSSIGEDFPLPWGLPNMLSEWISELPEGYSNLYVEPFSHHQQYYRAFAGVVDDDRYRDTMNVPGHVVSSDQKMRFTPGEAVAQVIPIHRESLLPTGVIRNDG